MPDLIPLLTEEHQCHQNSRPLKVYAASNQWARPNASSKQYHATKIMQIWAEYGYGYLSLGQNVKIFYKTRSYNSLNSHAWVGLLQEPVVLTHHMQIQHKTYMACHPILWVAKI
jgi:hypothetical protein